MAIEAFATALRGIPSTIAENAGLDAAEIVTQLRAEHATEGSKAGVDVIRGTVSRCIRERNARKSSGWSMHPIKPESFFLRPSLLLCAGFFVSWLAWIVGWVSIRLSCSIGDA